MVKEFNKLPNSILVYSNVAIVNIFTLIINIYNI